MAHLIDKSALVSEIKRRMDESWLGHYTKEKGIVFDITDDILSWIDTLEVKEGIETKLLPNKKQLEALKDLLHYNIGVFDYQKFMEVNSLYNDLTKIINYESDKQK